MHDLQNIGGLWRNTLDYESNETRQTFSTRSDNGKHGTPTRCNTAQRNVEPGPHVAHVSHVWL